MMSTDLLRYGNPVFEGYAYYTALLVIKMILMSVFTGFQRMRKKAVANPEDTAVGSGEVKVDEDVERIRRAHMNDVENIPIFMITGFLYVLTNPYPLMALMLFRIYTIARILHTIVYTIFVIRQPARTIMYFVGVIVNIIMAILVMCDFHQL